MPVKLEYRDCGAIFWAYGKLTGQEMLEANRAVYSHRFEGPFRYQLAINTRVKELLASPEELRELATMDREFSAVHPQITVAVADSDYLYGMLRIWNMSAESDTFATHVVRSIDEARKILREHDIELGDLSYPPNCN